MEGTAATNRCGSDEILGLEYGLDYIGGVVRKNAETKEKCLRLKWHSSDARASNIQPLSLNIQSTMRHVVGNDSSIFQRQRFQSHSMVERLKRDNCRLSFQGSFEREQGNVVSLG